MNETNNHNIEVEEEVDPRNHMDDIKPKQAIEIIKEKYPHVGQHLDILWGSKEFDEYIISIMFTDRSDRQGFDIKTFDILHSLYVTHIEMFKFTNLNDKNFTCK
jgi:hypothetical protein